MKNGQRIGLSLSGGGFRASVYHLGTLKKLKELEILKDIDVISTNSGGSITGAVYGLYNNDFERFEKIILNGVKTNITLSVLASRFFLFPIVSVLIFLILITYLFFTKVAWINMMLIPGFVMAFLYFQFRLFPVSKIIERVYNKVFFKNKFLSNLSKGIEIVINSTNLETGRLFTFSRRKMSDSKYDYDDRNKQKRENKDEIFIHQQFPIARAVAASACVPFTFTPVRINQKFYKDKSDMKWINPRLVDGGVYDNQGIHKITDESSTYKCDIIIVSDAGSFIPFQNNFRNTIALLIRTSDVFMNRIKNFQMIQNLYHNSKLGKREVAYQSLGFELRDSIKEFVKMIKNEQILNDILRDHNIETEVNEMNWDLVEEKLKQITNYSEIIKNANTPEQLTIARNVKTKLSPLKQEEIDALINHASLITELNVRLFCPTLFK